MIVFLGRSCLVQTAEVINRTRSSKAKITSSYHFRDPRSNCCGNQDMNKGRSYGFSAELDRKAKGNYSEEKEMECRYWIEAITGENLLPADLGWNNFSAALKNGVVLCKLINVLHPGSVSKIHQNKMAFKMMENIGNFLTACEKYGVPKLDLFQTVDLYEARNMNSVLQGLEALGRRARDCNFQGPTFGAKLSTENPRDFSDETMRAGQNVIGLQMGTNQGANQSGISYGSQRQVYDPKIGK